jgi:tetratricopeptide (TPR) repeat protein
MPGLFYRVERTDGSRLLLAVPSQGLRGWAWSRTVIPLAQAESYFSYVIRIKPGDPFPHLMRGLVRHQANDLEPAIADLDEALRLDPKNVAAWIERAALSQATNHPDQALVQIDRAIDLEPANPAAFVERGVLHFTRKEFDKSRQDLDRAASLGSRSVLVDVVRGMMDLEKADSKQAFGRFVHALQIDPRRHDARLGLASVYLMRGKRSNARAVLDEAVQFDPKQPEAYANRAILALALGDYDKALFNLDEVVRLAPTSARAHKERAWLLATCPEAKYRDGAQALAAATKACELTSWKQPHYLATLAAAYSETGDFDNAIQCQQRAISLLGKTDPAGAEFRRMLARYQARKPYHALGMLEELGIRGYQPPSKPGERTPG